MQNLNLLNRQKEYVDKVSKRIMLTELKDLAKNKLNLNFSWDNFEKFLKFLEKYEDNEIKWFKRLINYIYNILNSNIIFSKINGDEFLRYWLKDKNKFFGNISKTHLEIVQNLQIDNKFVKILEETWLNKWEVLLVKLFLDYIMFLYLWEYRKRENFYNTEIKTPAGWHFVKVIKNLGKFWILLKENNLLPEYRKIFEENKFLLFMSAIFHDVVEDKRLTLPINFVLDVKENIIFNYIEWVSPEVIFDDEKENILNKFFESSLNNYLQEEFNYGLSDIVKIVLKDGRKVLDEERLLEINFKNLKILLDIILVRWGKYWRKLVLNNLEKKKILEIVDYLTQRRHGSYYKGELDYIEEFLYRLKESPEAVLIKRADFLDNLSSPLSDKQKKKYKSFYIPFFQEVFNVKDLTKLVPSDITWKEKILENLNNLSSK